MIDRFRAAGDAMIPKAPFACDLTAEEELVLFERLKLRLADVWSTLIGSEDLPCTSVVVPLHEP